MVRYEMVGVFAAKFQLQDIMKDVLPDMSKGYSDKLESKVGYDGYDGYES